VGEGNAKFNESAGFRAQLNPSFTTGIFTGSPSGSALIARSGDPVPSFAATYTFSPFGGPLFNNLGEATFFSGVSSGGFLFFSGAPGTVAPVFINPATRAEYPSGAAFTDPELMGFNDKGYILLKERVSHPSVPTDADEVLMVRIPESSASWIRVAEGRQAAGRAPGVRYGSLDFGTRTAFDRNGMVAFVNLPSDGIFGLFAESDSGIAQLLKAGDELPGVPGSAVELFDAVVMDDRRGVVASVYYSDPFGSQMAAWASNTAGYGARVLAKTGDLAPDVVPCGVIDSVFVHAANRNHQTLLQVGLGGNSYFGDRVLYLHDRVRGLVKLVQTGTPFEVSPGDVRTVNSFRPVSAVTASISHGRPNWMDHAGNAMTILEFTDGTHALVRFRVDPAAFSCPADFNGDGLVDDFDFQIFAGAYNDLVVPPADGVCDVNADRVVDDVDFTLFAVAYNELLCP
jgi:hypothetical protein